MIICLAPSAQDARKTALAGVAAALQSRGLRLCGAIQIDTEVPGNRKCTMDLDILPAGPSIRISQNLGTLARGCRLDVGALEQAVQTTEQELTRNPDALLINKFGKHEAEGRGFRNAIAEAVSLGIPVILGINDLNFDALKVFCGEEMLLHVETADSAVAACLSHINLHKSAA